MINKLNKQLKVLALMVLIVIFTLFTRLFLLDQVPSNIQPDAADTIRTYLAARMTGEPSLFGFNWNGAPQVNAYLIGIIWELTGKTFAGVRFASAAISTVAVCLTFLLGFLFTKRLYLSFAVSIALSSNPWFLNFSRSGWENIFNATILVLILVGFYLYYETKRTRLALALIIPGSALGIYGYHPGKLFLPAVLFIMLIIPSNAQSFKVRVKCILITAVISLALISPQVLSMKRDPEHSFHRIAAVAVPKETDMVKYSIRTVLGFLLYSNTDYMQGINIRYVPLTERIVPPVIVLFFLVGIVVSVIRFPYIPLLFFLTLFPVQILSANTPNAARAVHIVPAIYLLALIGAAYTISFVAKQNMRLSRYVPLLIISLLFTISAMQLHSYATWITDPEILYYRNPAVGKDEYDAWLNTLIDKIREGDTGFTVDRWNTEGQAF